jgi:ribosome maturation factor RimP
MAARNASQAPRAAGAPASAVSERALHALLAPVITDAGYDLEAISVTAAGRRSVLRVTVDADGGIDLDSVADVARVVSQALDEHASTPMAGPYVLEVSSPGVERSLTEPRHWRRAIGRLVSTRAATTPLRGRIEAVGDSSVTFDVDGERLAVAFADLGPGRIEVEFSHVGQSPDDYDTADLDDVDDIDAVNDADSEVPATGAAKRRNGKG